MQTRPRQKRRGKRAKRPLAVVRHDAPAKAPQDIVPAGGSIEVALVETFRSYLTSLCQAVQELSFILLLLSLHTVYQIYGIDLVPDSHLKSVSKALVLLLGIFRLVQPVRSALLDWKAMPKRE